VRFSDAILLMADFMERPTKWVGFDGDNGIWLTKLSDVECRIHLSVFAL
ncbi:unnamed protein product, partial [Acidithrix sp. C25]